MIQKTTLFILLAAAISSAAFAEGSGRVGEILARAIPSTAHVGDEVRLVIQAEIPKGFSIEPISAKTNFSPFELRSIDKPLVCQKKQTIVETIIVRLAAFETGDAEIPSIPLKIWSIDRHSAEGRTPPAAVHIVSVGRNKTDKADIRPIKGPAEISLRYLLDWIFGGLLVLLSVILGISLFFRRQKEAADLESLLPAHERAILEIERLNDNHWLAAGKDKEHFSGLSDILRRYLRRRFALEVMEHTTAEIIVILKQKRFDDSIIARSQHILENSDLVKFAKFVPSRTLASDLEMALREIVDKTKLAAQEAFPGRGSAKS